jgi:hypothetical protein
MTPEETKAYFKAYYQKNKDKMLKRAKERNNSLDREELKNYRKNYYNANKEILKEINKKNSREYRKRLKERKLMSNEDKNITI